MCIPIQKCSTLLHFYIVTASSGILDGYCGIGVGACNSIVIYHTEQVEDPVCYKNLCFTCLKTKHNFKKKKKGGGELK